MATSTTAVARVVSHADPSAALATSLEQAGFDPAQIKRLDELKAVYPYLEFTDSMEEWRRLNFHKWRHATGRLFE